MKKYPSFEFLNRLPLIAAAMIATFSALSATPLQAGAVINYVTANMTANTVSFTGTGFNPIVQGSHTSQWYAQQLQGTQIQLGTRTLTVTSQSATTVVATLPANITPGTYPLSINGNGFGNTLLSVDIGNSGFGLDSEDRGNGNTASGTGTLFSLTTGLNNTAMGFQALFSNTTGNSNTASGYQALYSNTTAAPLANLSVGNTATGYQAMYSNTEGISNTADGCAALSNNTTGDRNTSIGRATLASNTTGSRNTASGNGALLSNTTGFYNEAIGVVALPFTTTGNSNIAVGAFAGFDLGSITTVGDNNIYIANFGMDGESNTIRIGNSATSSRTVGGFPSNITYTLQAHTATFIAGIFGATTSDAASTTPVVIDMNGNLGTAASSERFKKDIKPMDKGSEGLLALKPVTFHYKSDTKDTPQFGLVAEEVAKVNPGLVIRDAKGGIYTVRYDAVNAMLLNEFLKEHKKVEQLEKQIETLTAGLQKVSAQVELNKPSPQMAVNSP